MTVCSSDSGTDLVRDGAFVRAAAAAAATARPRPGAALLSFDPLVMLGLDLFFNNVLLCLDASSLAACTAVCTAWRACCTSDLLWWPLLSQLLARRAHLPLSLLHSPSPPLTRYFAYSIIMLDASKVELSPAEMCARVWEMKVKPTCGAYWCSLDPTSRDEDPLLRRFQCDHSITPLQDKDPIWGGQESVWVFVKAKTSDSRKGGQCVQINSWPQHHVMRLPDGRWRLDNYYSSYTSCPDQEENTPSYVKGKLIRFCARCNPEQIKKKEE
eukprot:c11158_g1_i1 orf=76-885(+)